MVVKVKQQFETTRHVKKKINLKNTFYEDEKTQIIMKEFYLIKRNLVISRPSSVQKTYDISRKGSHPHPTPYSPPKSQKYKS